jgi:peptide/nickel transport system substrate-binding protein
MPVLAENMEMAEGGQQVTFTLRPNVKWHNMAPVNGRVMDMDDWKSTLERFLVMSNQRTALLDILDKAEYPDSTHMVLKMRFPYGPFVDQISNERFAFMVMPKELNADLRLAATVPIGTGFKVLDKHQPAITMEYKANADYWGGKPFIDRWHYPSIPEYANRYAQFVSKNIISFTPTARDVLGMAKDAPEAVIVGSELQRGNIARLNIGRINSQTRAYKDPRVRVAMRKSINMRGIAEVQANKEQFDAAGIPVEISMMTHATREPQWWLDPMKGELGKASSNYVYDLAEAKKLTTAAGYNDIIDLNWVFAIGTSGGAPEVEMLMFDSLNQSGIFRAKAVNETNSDVSYECWSERNCDAISRTGRGTQYDMDYYMREMTSAGARPNAEPAYPHATLDRIAEEFRRTVDQERRIALVKEWQMFQAEWMSIIPAFDDYSSFSFQWPWLHNVNHGEVAGRPYWGGHKMWLGTDMPKRNG